MKLVNLFSLLILVFGFSQNAQSGNRDFPGACRADKVGRYQTVSGGCLDRRSGLVWSRALKGKASYKTASKYCISLKEGGREDWRLATRNELLDISKNSAAESSLHFFRRADFFWTRGEKEAKSSWAVIIKTQDVKDNEEMLGVKASVVCVREPADIDKDGYPDSVDRCNWPNKSDFQLAEDRGKDRKRKGCIVGETAISAGQARRFSCLKESERFQTQQGGCRFKSSNLVWSAEAMTTKLYRYAQLYCRDLAIGPWKDWRFPSKEELTRIAGKELAVGHLLRPSAKKKTSDFWVDGAVSSYKFSKGIAINYFQTWDYLQTVDLVNEGSKKYVYKYRKYLVDIFDNPNDPSKRTLSARNDDPSVLKLRKRVICVRTMK